MDFFCHYSLVYFTHFNNRLFKNIKVYDCFVEGAKEGVSTALEFFYLLTMLVAIGVFRASGALDYLLEILGPIFGLMGVLRRYFPLFIETFIRVRSTSNFDRYSKKLSSRFFCRQGGIHFNGFSRNYFLYFGSIFWFYRY